MLIIRRHNTNPYFNLATEEYVLKNFSEDSFMLWKNAPSIIVGKHQNTLAEINADYVREHGIPVVRRLSGGGAVFHDLGNLNFTFIQKGREGSLIDFRKYTRPILEVLTSLGIDARFEGRNDLTIGGLKFSGNAEHVWKDRVLHHGTLLFSAHMNSLAAALNADPAKFRDKAVKSVRSRVTNISEHLKEPMTVDEFAERINAHILGEYPDARMVELSAEDHLRIEEMVTAKYGTWEWNYGYSPRYNFRKFLRTEKSGTIEFDLDVQNGTINHLRIFGDYFGRHDTEELETMLKGVAHDRQSVASVLGTVEIGDYIVGLTSEEFLSGIF